MTTTPKKPGQRLEKDERTRDVDRESEESFPASDSPSYGGVIIGEPWRPDEDSKKS